MSFCKGSHWFQELQGGTYSHTCRPLWCHRLGRSWSPQVCVGTLQVCCTGFPQPGNTSTEWLLSKMCSILSFKVMFPNLVKLSAVAQSLSVTNAWPERGTSALKRIKTRLWNSLKDNMLNSLLQISINGLPVSEAKDKIEKVVRLSCQLRPQNNSFYKMLQFLTVEEINNFINLCEIYKGISYKRNISIQTRECRFLQKWQLVNFETRQSHLTLKTMFFTTFIILSNNCFCPILFLLLFDWENQKHYTSECRKMQFGGSNF